MLIADRNGMAVPKPLPYDAEVEYLESTGMQYIRTGIKGSDIRTGGVEVDSMHTAYDYAISSHWPVAAGISPVDNFCMNGLHNSTTDLYWRFGSARRRCRPNGFPSNPPTFVGTRLKSSALSGTVSVSCDGVAATNMYDGGFSYDYLCADNSGYLCFFSYDNCVRPSIMRLFGARVWDNNRNLILDIVPVRFTNENGLTEGAMFDKVSKTLFRNAGTGAFVFPTA